MRGAAAQPRQVRKEATVSGWPRRRGPPGGGFAFSIALTFTGHSLLTKPAFSSYTDDKPLGGGAHGV